MTRKEIEQKAKEFSIKLKRHPSNNTELENIICDFAEGLVKNLKRSDVSDLLPNEIDLEELKKLLKFSDKYEISIQFWPEDIAVYIHKDGVYLTDFGGNFDYAIGMSIKYLNRITGNNYR